MVKKRPALIIGNPILLLPMWGLGSTAQAGIAGRVFLSPYWVPRKCTLDELYYRLAVQSVSKHTRFGGYADKGGTPVGGTLYFDTGDILTETALQKLASITPNVVINRGLVWIAQETEDTTMQFWRGTSNSYMPNAALAPMMDSCYFDLSPYGALPDPCPTVSSTSIRMAIVLHVASINE